MYQGLSGQSIAFNEHGIAPRDSALGKRAGADDERKRNARAAKATRRARRAAPPKGPRQPAPRARRERTVLRALRVQIRKAMSRGETNVFAKLATKFELLMAQRSQRLQAAEQ